MRVALTTQSITGCEIGQIHYSEARTLKEVLVFALKDISALTPFLHFLHIKPQGALS